MAVLAEVGNEDGERTPPDHLLVKAQELLAPVNLGTVAPQGSITMADFAERNFLPTIKAKAANGRMKHSTYKFYADLVKNHIKPLLGAIRLNEIKTGHVQRMLDARSQLSQPSVLRIKTGASAILSYAIRLEFIEGVNVAREAKAEGKRSSPDTYAYSLAEVLWMLERLPEPARTVVAVAAFAGLRESELRGLQWPDYDGQFLDVQRSVWRTHVGDTKTDESKKKLPVIEPLRKILDTHKRKNGSGKWIFAGEKMGRPLHLDNLSRRVIRPVVRDRWHGWHAFRRSLGTVLFGLGVPAEIASVILRHAGVSVTQEHYILLKSQREGRAAMNRLSRIVRRKLDAQNRREPSNPRQQRTSRRSSVGRAADS